MTFCCHSNLGYSCPVQYQNLTDSWRKIGNPSSTNCDRSTRKFNGTTWFRFVEPAGTMLSTSPPAKSSCGTSAVSWMNGAHPTIVGQSVSRKICFRWDSECQWSRENTRVKGCRDYDGKLFYIYQFRQTQICNAAYCAL